MRNKTSAHIWVSMDLIVYIEMIIKKKKQQ